MEIASFNIYSRGLNVASGLPHDFPVPLLPISLSARFSLCFKPFSLHRAPSPRALWTLASLNSNVPISTTTPSFARTLDVDQDHSVLGASRLPVPALPTRPLPDDRILSVPCHHAAYAACFFSVSLRFLRWLDRSIWLACMHSPALVPRRA